MIKKRNEINANFLNNSEYKSQFLNGVDKNSVKRFFNRELSWISFNDRVLEEAGNSKVPLLERVRFLAISAENLDEFYSVRVAGLKELVRENLSRVSVDGLLPQEQIEKIEKLTRSLMEKQQFIWKELLNELKNSGICILSKHDLLTSDLKPLELLKASKDIEISLGRKKRYKNAPRECDIDIIDYKSKKISQKINLPHPRMHNRNFVLFPLFELNKNWKHPISKDHIKKLIISLPNRDIRSIKQI